MIQATDVVELGVHTRLSFKPFLDYLRAQIAVETTIKRELLQYALDKFNAYPELDTDMPLEDLGRYREVFDILFVLLSSILEDEKDSYWGLSVPMTPLVFYGTDLFFDLLSNADTQQKKIATEESERFFERQKLEHFYSYVLDRFYSLRFRNHNGLVKHVVDPHTGLSRHYRINIDTRFLEPTLNGDLPKLNSDSVRSSLLGDEAIAALQQAVPASMFSFSGFSILTITDVTTEYAIDAIRQQVVISGQPDFDAIVGALNELVGTKEVEFNILPLFRINGRLVDNPEASAQSIIFDMVMKQGMKRGECMSLLEKFAVKPEVVYYRDLDKEVPADLKFAQIMIDAGLKSYSLVPVFYNGNLVGAIEMYSRVKGLLDKKLFTSLEPAMLLMAQLLQNSITSFQDGIDAVIKEKFTNLQPAVQWKFNEVAWEFVSRPEKKSNAEPHEIMFENVYPLYGAVDIRNSTIERNAALNQDLKIQFTILISVLQEFREKTGFELIEEKLYSCRHWLDKISNDETIFNEEIALNDFIENDITPFLRQFSESRPDLKTVTARYFSAVDEVNGAAYENRRQLEASMNTVINSVNTYFDLLRDQVQQAYPVYFEKFRTDGVEYDIYIGQSITPDRVYTELYLKNLRLMQLTSMVAIARNTLSLLPDLARPVRTTQLIFIHSHTIDIRFRRDEKRFDVEGAYNIRYHIIKKRIDKVRVRDTQERLTQPDKIALVYFNQKEADEYVNYIHYLQGEHLLEDNLEFLELEEMQGVSGLRAMRVGIVVDKKTTEEPASA